MAKRKNDTRAAAEGEKRDSAKFWLSELTAAEKRDRAWITRARKVVDRYRDERDLDARSERRTNILWSNTEVLKSVLFQGIGQPDVRRRFPKRGKDERAAKQAALVIERGLAYCADDYDLEAQAMAAVEDMLLPGRGQCWVVYDADVATKPKDADPNEGGDTETTETEAVDISDQSVRFEHVFYEDYRTSAGRKESDIWWKARRHQYSRDELKEYFPKDADQIPLDATMVDRPMAKEDEEDTFKRSNVWEIWDKSKRERVYIAEGFPHILKKDADPYTLKEFYPCPAALYSCKTTSSLTPIPEYTLYQDQAEELDAITTRLHRLIDALKRRGVYDASLEGADNQLSQLAYAGDNEFLPYKGFAALMERGGLKGAFQSEDLAPIIATVSQLYQQRALLIQTIYEVTGISDVIRGASVPTETATAQRIKGQFGTLRINARRKAIDTFLRDLFRIKGEILSEHFTREKLSDMTGLDLPLEMEIEAAKQQLAMFEQQKQMAAQAQQQPQQPTPQAPQGMPPGAPMPPQGAMPMPPQMPMPEPDPAMVKELTETSKAVSWERVSDILRSDKRRGYKVDIETTDTVQADADAEKQSRMEFLTAMQAFMANTLPAVANQPELVPLVKELAMFTVGAFKAGRCLEESFDDAFSKIGEAAEAAAKQPPPPNPDVIKAQADAETAKVNAAAKQADIQAQQQSAAVDAKMRQDEMAMKQQEMLFNQQLKREEFEFNKQMQREKLEMERQFKNMQLSFDWQQGEQKNEIAKQAARNRAKPAAQTPVQSTYA
jgi:hypothetical protein